MHPMLDMSAWDDANAPMGAFVVADGVEVSVTVRGKMLVIKDGPMGQPRERAIAKVPRIVKHIAIFQNHGYISLDAMAWMEGCEITWCVIDRSGRTPSVLATSGRYVNPHYMRQQAMCAPTGPFAETGVKIFRRLISAKLSGQARNAIELFGDKGVSDEIAAKIPAVQCARNIVEIMGHEGQAADKYWNLWRGRPVMWKAPAPAQPHWLNYPGRSTLLRDWSTNRDATDPINAALNFAYFCAEVECTLAAYAHSFSPVMGIGHADRPGRDSFSLDLIEVIRPDVDMIVAQTFAAPLDDRLFREGKEGAVMLCAPLTHQLARQVHGLQVKVIQSLFAVRDLLDTEAKFKPLTS